MNRDFEPELREDLAVIKTKQQSNSESLGVFLEKTQTQEVELKTVENNIKTIFKRLDEMRAEAKENKIELNKVIDDKCSDIFRLATFLSGIISMFISILALILK